MSVLLYLKKSKKEKKKKPQATMQTRENKRKRAHTNSKLIHQKRNQNLMFAFDDCTKWRKNRK